MAAGVRADFHEREGDSDWAGSPTWTSWPRAFCAERAVHRHFLRDCDHLGTRSGHHPQVSGESHAPCGLGAGKGPSAGLRGLSQAAIIYLLSVLLGVDIDWHPLCLLGVAAAVVLGAAFFATLSLIVACLVKTRERFMGMGQLLTMPLFLPATRSIRFP